MTLRMVSPARALVAAALVAAVASLPQARGEDAAQTVWTLAESDAAPRLTAHSRSAETTRVGRPVERIRLEASAGTVLRIQAAIGPAAVIDELRCAAWVRSSRPDVRVGVRIVLPAYRSRRTGRPV
jgi:hypothetical protein